MKCVMVVDDDPVLRGAVKLTLSGSGYEVLEADSGEAALAICSSQQPDLILCDLHMPGQDGRHFLGQVRMDPALGAIPLILTTGDRESMDVRLALDLGADDFLAKPFTEAELLKAVDARLQRPELQKRVLIESQHTLQQILDCLPARVFWKNRELHYLGCNQRFAADAGFECPSEFIGRTDFDAAWKAEAALFQSDDRVVMESGQPRLNYEERQTRPDGECRWLRTSKVPLTDPEGSVTGVLGIYDDITDLKDVDELLRDALAYNETLFTTAPIGMVTYRATGEAISANPAAAKLVGASVQDLLQTDFRQLFSWHTCDLLQLAETALASHEEQECEASLTTSFGKQIYVAVRFVPFNYQGRGHLLALLSDLSERKRAEDELRKLNRAVEQSPASVVITDTKGDIEYVNPRFTQVTGYEAHEVLGRNPRVLKAGDLSDTDYREMWSTLKAGREWRGEFHNRHKNGDLFWESASISPIKDDAGRITHFLAVKEDITEKKLAQDARLDMELQLRHAQKMESIGQLAAGIAHEINTPTQFVGDNLRFLEEAFADLHGLFALVTRGGSGPDIAPDSSPWREEVLQAAERADLGYLVEEIPKAIKQSLEGISRVGRIVRAMKEFSHPGSEQKTDVDLNRALETTATVSRNEWKYVANLVTDLDPNLPPVPCLPGEFNQVMLNLIVNAAHAIAEVVNEGSQQKGTITVSSRHQGDRVEIQVRDTGAGVPEAIRSRVFDPFFTTKGVGKGTGQGLAIAHSVIVDKHGGHIDFETEPGVGTTFILHLPLPGPSGKITALQTYEEEHSIC